MAFSHQFFCILILITPLTLTCYAQEPDLSNQEVSQRAADTIARRSFAKMVAGTEDITSVANYVSFVPTDGKFTLAGNSFFTTKNSPKNPDRPLEYFAIGFNAAGSIVGGTVATLFDEGKLNTGTDLGLRFSWRMNVPNIGAINSESQIMIDKRNALYFERQKKIDSVKNAIFLFPDKIRQSELTLSELRRKTVLIVVDTVKVRALVNASATDSARLKLTDSLMGLKNKIFANRQKIRTLEQDSILLKELYNVSKIDKNTDWMARTPEERWLSSKYGLNRKGISYADTVQNKIKKDYQDKIYAVEIARPIQGMRVNWLSAIGNWNRKSYRTYTSSLAYGDALVKNNFNGFTAGLQANFYTFYRPVQKASLFNIAFLVKRTNNLDDLTTSKLNEESVVTNGSTTRKSSTDYTVYTDPVEVYTTWQLPINYYHFFGKDLSYGWHALGQADWRSTHKSIYDVGAGFIFGLNTAGAKRLFNIELFATYKDIGRELITNKEDSNWKQLQVGVSIAIPFMIYKN